MQTYWTHYIVPRRTLTFQLLKRAQADGSVAPDADLDVLVDMLAGAVTYRVLQPNPPTMLQMKRYSRNSPTRTSVCSLTDSAQELVGVVRQVQQRLRQRAERERDGGGDRDDGRAQHAGHHDRRGRRRAAR